MAETYLSSMAFSRTGLIEQLVFEGFSNEDAAYGTDAVGADWMNQAALMAETYLASMSFSRSGLVEQLVFEGFTPEEAEFGVASTGL
jgi:acyl-coenzyme A synthetase/AMP-(fatty) acid ligase